MWGTMMLSSSHCGGAGGCGGHCHCRHCHLVVVGLEETGDVLPWMCCHVSDGGGDHIIVAGSGHHCCHPGGHGYGGCIIDVGHHHHTPHHSHPCHPHPHHPHRCCPHPCHNILIMSSLSSMLVLGSGGVGQFTGGVVVSLMSYNTGAGVVTLVL